MHAHDNKSKRERVQTAIAQHGESDWEPWWTKRFRNAINICSENGRRIYWAMGHGAQGQGLGLFYLITLLVVVCVLVGCIDFLIESFAAFILHCMRSGIDGTRQNACTNPPPSPPLPPYVRCFHYCSSPWCADPVYSNTKIENLRFNVSGWKKWI